MEQLQEMVGKPVLLKSPWWTEWCILRQHEEHEIAGDAISFTRRYRDVVCLGLADYGKTWTAYAYPPVRIDREKWKPCKLCSTEMNCASCDNAIRPITSCGDCIVTDNGKTEWKCDSALFCRYCGRPLTEEAWAELERRVCGG